MSQRIKWVTLLCLMFCNAVQGEESPEVRAAIDRGVDYLRTRVGNSHGGHRALIALAMYKGGESIEAPELQSALKSILDRFKDGSPYGTGSSFVNSSEAIYAAGVEATFLADVDSEKYREQIKLIGDYLLSRQFSNGAWDYRPFNNGAGGDTSVTQYACLGIWAVERAGIEVDPEVWAKVLDWHTNSQSGDGGFAYTPQEGNAAAGNTSTMNMSVNGIGSMHIAMLHLSPGFLPLKQDLAKKNKPLKTKKFGVLKDLEIEVKKPTVRPTIAAAAVTSVRRCFSWLVTRFSPVNREAGEFKAYYFYSLERMAALADIDEIGNHDWFQECSQAVMQLQQQDGSWKLSQDGSGRDTAFCVLFLTRSTAKVLKRKGLGIGVGDGTLAGGRGLPDDLKVVQYNGRQVTGSNEPVPPLDQLLASLQNTDDIDLDKVQTQFVEQVQLGDRKELIGQVDQLLKLAKHPSADVRRVAIWALGRSDRLDQGTLLVEALNDQDLGVIIEARNALCWLSRKPKGFGHAESPLFALPPDATPEQQQDAIASWHRNLVLDWGKWYLQNRPFDDRGDRFEAELTRQMQQLQQNSAPARTPRP